MIVGHRSAKVHHSHQLFVVALLLVGVLLLMWSAATQAGTYDEITFLGVGRYLWHSGDFDIQHVRFHPPLMYYVNSIFLEFGPGRWDLGLDASKHFTYFAGRGYLYRGGQSPDAVLLLVRYPFVLLFVLLGAVLYRWGLEVYGRSSALLTLALYVTSPTVLAHASIAGNDFLLTVTYTLTIFVLWQALRRSGWWRWVLMGGLWGATLLTKATGMVLWGVVPLLSLWSWWASRKGGWTRRIPLWGVAVGVLGASLIALLVVASGYGFHALPAFTAETRPHRKIDLLIGWMGTSVRDQVYRWIEIPIPGYRYVTMLMRQFAHVTEGHEAYLLGQRSTQGWWYFFPVAMSIKTPMTTLLLWLGGISGTFLQAFRRQGENRWRVWNSVVWWGTPIGVILLPAMAGSANMGVRLVLPIYPFLFLFAGTVLAFWEKRYRWWRRIVWAMVLLGFLSVLLQAPRYLSYVNEAWGGPQAGWQLVGDSNYDWGQSLKELKAYLDEQGIEEIYLAYFGGELPQMRGIVYKSLPCHPVRGVVVISVTYLQGLYLDNPECYSWLRTKSPVAKIGHTLWVYDLR